MANYEDVKRGSLNQSTTCSVQTEEKSNALGRFQGRILGYCSTIHRLNWDEIGARMGYVAGCAFIVGSRSSNIDCHGYKPVVGGASDVAGHGTVQNE